ncbi:MAG TPA: pyridoxal phosphate-dependent aminotransferase [Firmicutes bacterium]|nr:pyridoxal phosphate-dependent aminotransferase [Bacillota bacterium]
MTILSERARRIAPSATMAMDAKTKELLRQGVDVVNFTVGEPDFDTPAHVKKAAVEAINAGFNKYTPVAGIPELKEAVCYKFKRDNGLTYTPAEIAVSIGAKHSLYNIFQVLLDPGDEVIIPAPYWVSYLEQVKVADGCPVVLSSREEQGFRLDAAQIKEVLTPRTKALILNSPSNPTGCVYSRRQLEEIAALAVEKQFFVISDEVYEPFIYSDTGHVSIAQISPEVKEMTLIVHGLSKSHSMTGWRIGYTAGRKEIIAAISSLQSHSTSNPASMAQKAAVVALTGSQDSVTEMREAFRRRRDIIVKRLNSIPGLSCRLPEGAFYVFPNISKLFGRRYKGQTVADSMQLAELLLTEAHVATVPGSAFGAEGYLRISYATSEANIEKGLDRIAAFVAALE